MLILSDEFLNKIVNKYGIDEQLRQTMGECGELIAVLQNYHRAKKYGHKTETLEEVMGEAVDVYFMIQQVRTLDPKLFDHLCNIKQQKVIAKVEIEN